jgi:uncharacterized protein (DUF427 family)
MEIPALDVPALPDCSPKWIRVFLNGVCVADSRRALLVRTRKGPPLYLFPQADVRRDCLQPPAGAAVSSRRGIACWDVVAGTRRMPLAAWEYRADAAAPEALLAGHVGFDWAAMDAWYEEDEAVYVHARDPQVRIDILRSRRHVRIEALGLTLAETRCPVLLFETGLPVRYYLSPTDVRCELLVPSEHLTRCPYKGEAHYYSLQHGGQRLENLAWYYRYPTAEAAGIAGLICFYPQKVAGFHVDGIPQTEPA